MSPTKQISTWIRDQYNNSLVYMNNLISLDEEDHLSQSPKNHYPQKTLQSQQQNQQFQGFQEQMQNLYKIYNYSQDYKRNYQLQDYEIGNCKFQNKDRFWAQLFQEKKQNLQSSIINLQPNENESQKIKSQIREQRNQYNQNFQNDSFYQTNQQANQMPLSSENPSFFINQLEQYCDILQKGDFSVLYKDKYVTKLIIFTAKYRYLLPTSIRQTVKQFLDRVKSRIQSFPFANLLYQQLLAACQQLSETYQYVGNRRNVLVTQNQRNKIYQHLVQQAQTKPRRQAIYYVQLKSLNKRISLGQYMSQSPQFFKNRKWRQIMDIVQSQVQKMNLKQQFRHDNQQIIKIVKKIDYSKNIYNKTTLNLSCLGCCEYFIVNWNIFDQSVNRGKLVLGGKVLDMISKKSAIEDKENIIKKITQQVCALLNSGGGFIIFNCETIYLSVIPRGQFITRQQGKQIQRIIKEEVIKRINPKIYFENQIAINFMRMLKDPIMEEKQFDTKNINYKMFVEGLFVVRITVRPTSNTVYQYQDKGQLYQAFRYKSISENQLQCILLKDKLTLQQSSIKSSKKQTSQNWVSNYVNSPFSQFDHQKCKCQKNFLKAEQLPVQKQPEEQITENPQKIFKQATAMVVKKQNFQEFKRRLKKLNFQHFCQFPFKNSKVKGANATVILYHNKSSAEITQMINYNTEFEFNDRNTVTVFITDHIKLINRLNKNFLPYQQFQNLQLWIDHEFKDEKCKLQMCTYRNQSQQNEYYLRIRGQRAVKKCTLYVYLVSNHFSERAQLRSPKQPQKLQTFNYRVK